MLKSNKINILISIVAAIVIWAFVTIGINPPKDLSISGIPVEITNVESLHDRGLTINKAMSYTIDVSIRGARTDIESLTPSDFRATADITGFPKGINPLKVKVTGPSNVQINQIRPENIEVEVFDFVAVTKPVKLSFAEEFPAGMEPGFITITPDEMEVTGTPDAVANIDHVGAEIPEGALSDDITKLTLEAVAINKNGEAVANTDLSQDTVSVQMALCSTKTVPLTVNIIGDSPEDVEITKKDFPKTIAIRGHADELEKITTVVARDIDISNIVETTSIPIVPLLPETVEMASASQGISAVIEVRDLERAEFTYNAEDIEVRGLMSGFTGHVNTGSVVVTIVASKEEIGGITKENIKLFVDASTVAKAEDSIEMAVQYETEKTLNSLVVAPAKVRVTVNG